MDDIITSISTAIGLAKRLNKISKNIEDAEFTNLLADLSLELAATKLKLSDIIIENTELKQKIYSLEQAHVASNGFILYKGIKFKRSPSGKLENIPYCPSCEVGMASTSSGNQPFVCGKCSTLSAFKSSEITSILLEVESEYPYQT